MFAVGCAYSGRNYAVPSSALRLPHSALSGFVGQGVQAWRRTEGANPDYAGAIGLQACRPEGASVLAATDRARRKHDILTNRPLSGVLPGGGAGWERQKEAGQSLVPASELVKIAR